MSLWVNTTQKQNLEKNSFQMYLDMKKEVGQKIMTLAYLA